MTPKFTVQSLPNRIPSEITEINSCGFSRLFFYSCFMPQYFKFMFQKDVRRIFFHFSALLGIRTTFFSLDGSQLHVGGEKPNCTYCTLLREKLGYKVCCDTFDENKRQEAEQLQDLVAYECPGGMTGATAPIISHGKVLCFVMIGQFRQSDHVPDKIAQEWRRIHGTEELNTAYMNTPLYEPNKIEDIMGLLSMLVKYVASQNMIHISNSPIVPLLQYIDDHPEDMLGLQDAADLVHRSISSLSHLFKKTTGKGFRQYQIEKKLDKADDYFRTSQALSVAQVAKKLGYEDPLYFSKLYKKHRGYPPVQAIKQFRANFSDVQNSSAMA